MVLLILAGISISALTHQGLLDKASDAKKVSDIANIKEQIEFASKNVGLKDYKTFLQEKLQVHGEVLIKYEIIKEEGPDHNKTFTAQVSCDGKKLASGTGRSKKAAEMEAARKAIEILE